MERTALLLTLLADLLSEVDLLTVVAEPIPDDFADTVPAVRGQSVNLEESDE